MRAWFLSFIVHCRQDIVDTVFNVLSYNWVTLLTTINELRRWGELWIRCLWMKLDRAHKTRKRVRTTRLRTFRACLGTWFKSRDKRWRCNFNFWNECIGYYCHSWADDYRVEWYREKIQRYLNSASKTAEDKLELNMNEIARITKDTLTRAYYRFIINAEFQCSFRSNGVRCLKWSDITLVWKYSICFGDKNKPSVAKTPALHFCGKAYKHGEDYIGCISHVNPYADCVGSLGILFLTQNYVMVPQHKIDFSDYKGMWNGRRVPTTITQHPKRTKED